MFNLFKKEKPKTDEYRYTIYDEDMTVLAGMNDLEKAQKFCDALSENKETKFYICSDTTFSIYVANEFVGQNLLDEVEKMIREQENPTKAPYIPKL